MPEIPDPDLATIQAELDLEENLQAAIGDKRFISTFYIKEGEFDKAVAPASFPIFWEPDSIGQQVEALFVLKILSEERISVTVDCEDCRPIEADGKLGQANSSIHSHWDGKPSDLMVSAHWKIQLRPRKLPLANFKDQVLKVRMRSAQTYLEEAKTKLKLNQPVADQANFQLSYEDEAVYLAQSFLRKMTVAMAMHDRNVLLAPLDKTMDSLELAIDSARQKVPNYPELSQRLPVKPENKHTFKPEELKLIELLDRQSSLQMYRGRLMPRLLVLAREVPCE